MALNASVNMRRVVSVNSWVNFEGDVGTEQIFHDVDAGGNCRVPWCDYSSKIEHSEHINVDRVLDEPGRFNMFNQLQRLIEESWEMRRILLNEFKEEVNEDADAHLMATHHLTLRVLRQLKAKADSRNDKIKVIAAERDKYMSALSTVTSYVSDTFPMRARSLDPDDLLEPASLVIAVVEQLRKDLTSIQDQLNEPACNLRRHAPDHLAPEERHNVTLNDLHAMLQGLVLSGADIAVRDLHEYVQRHVSATYALIKTSLELEGYSDECCLGCEEHGAKNEDPKYDRPHGKKCYYCVQYGIGRCKKHAPQAQGRL